MIPAPIHLKINQNMTLAAIRTDKFKAEILKLSIALPANRDALENACFCLLIHVLRSGCEGYPEKADIVCRLNDLYDASCSVSGYALGDNRIFEISADFLSQRYSHGLPVLDGVIDLIYRMLCRPVLDAENHFRADVIEREKKVIGDRLKSEKNNSREYAFKRCREILCSEEAYGFSLQSEDVNPITAPVLTAFYQSFLSEAEITFSYVGDLSAEDVSKKIKEKFGDGWPIKKAEIHPLQCSSKGPDAKIRYEQEVLPLRQSVLTIGMRTGTLLNSPDAHVMWVFNNIYGGTFTSRLFRTVREKLSLCYYCASDFVSSKGLMFVSCGIDADKKELTQQEIFRQLTLLQETLVEPAELRIAKDMAMKDLKDLPDYPSAIVSFRLAREVYGLHDTVENLMKKIETVSAEDVKAMANKIHPDTIFFLHGQGIPKDCDAAEESADAFDGDFA